MNIVLLGAPGAGKGTQARMLCTSHGFVQLSTGEMLRAAIAAGTEVGKKVDEVIKAGHLVDDAVVIAVVEERLGAPDVAKGVIFDGFPRTIPQAEALDRILAAKNLELDAAIDIGVDDEAMIARVSGRYTCASCGEGYHHTDKRPAVDGTCDKCGGTEFKTRKDDNPDTVRARLVEYHEETEPLIDYYRTAGKLKTVDGMAEIDNVNASILDVLQGVPAGG